MPGLVAVGAGGKDLEGGEDSGSDNDAKLECCYHEVRYFLISIYFTVVCKTMKRIQSEEALACAPTLAIKKAHDVLCELYGFTVATNYTPSVVRDASSPGQVTLGTEKETLAPLKVKYSTLFAEFTGFHTTVSELILELEGDDRNAPEEQKSVLCGAAAIALKKMEGLRLLTAARAADNIPGKSLALCSG